MTVNRQFDVGLTVIIIYLCAMVQRYFYDRMLKLLKKFPAVGVIGARQSGKTTLAFNAMKDLKLPSLYLDLESASDRRKLGDPELFLKQQSDKLVILDEIQRMPELFALLRHIIDQKRKPGRFLLLGSASPDLLKDSSETLAGRIFYLDAHPFNLTEVPQNKNTLQRHWFRGGFPSAYLARSNEDSLDWMQGFIRTFLERDLNQLFGVNFSPQLMFKLWRMLAHHHTGLWNANSFSKGLDVSPTTVNRYIDYLEGAFIVRKLSPYFHNTKKRLIKTPKVYFRDSGMLHHLHDIFSLDMLKEHPVLGHSWEGYVIEQIVQLLPRNIHPFYYRTQDGSEMDLILIKGLKPVPCIEIKYSTVPVVGRGMVESVSDLKCKNNFIIIPSDETGYTLSKTFKVIGLHPFLTKHLPSLY
jgi:predicted AAA+ superfamily ATPase